MRQFRAGRPAGKLAILPARESAPPERLGRTGNPDRPPANRSAPNPVYYVDDDPNPSFERFYRRRGADTLRYAAAILGAVDAEDAWQEAWLRIWRAWGTSDPERVDAWAFRIVRNCCFDRRRAWRFGLPLEHAAVVHVPPPDDLAIARAEAASAVRLLDRLAPVLREALWLREVMGWSYAEIAGAQRVPIGTVMSRLHKARRKAARILRAEGF